MYLTYFEKYMGIQHSFVNQEGMEYYVFFTVNIISQIMSNFNRINENDKENG